MKTKITSKWIALLIVFVISVSVGMSTAANAETMTYSTWEIAPNSTDSTVGWDTIRDGNIQSVVSSNTSIIQVKNFSYNSIEITSSYSGTTNLIVTTKVVSTGVTNTITIPVTITGTSTTTRTGTSNPSIQVGQAYTVPKTYYSISSVTSSAPAIANVTYTSVVANQNVVVISGLSVGSATILVNYSESAGGTIYQDKYIVTVTTAPSTSTTGTTGTTSTTPDFTCEAGTGFKLPSDYYEISNVTSSNPSIVTVEPSGTAGTMNLRIRAISAGDATISFSYRPSSTASFMSARLSIRVTGTASSSGSGAGSGTSGTGTTTTTTSSSGGISFGSRTSFNVEVGKKYRLKNITLDGEQVNPDQLLWLTNDTDLLTVGQKTGIFKATQAGTATLIAVDIYGKSVKSIEVNISD